MLPPKKSQSRNLVSASQYDAQFAESKISFEPRSAKVQELSQIDEGSLGLITRDYNKRLKEGGVNYVPGMDINTQLAAHQSGRQQLGRVLMRGGIGALAATIESTAFLLDFEHHINTLKGVEQEYDNWLSKALRSMEDSAREAYPIYTRSEKPDIMSADWWAKNGDQMIRSIGYLAPGAAYFKAGSFASRLLLGKAANLLGKTVTGTKKASDISAAVSSALALNYGEHAVSGATHIKDNYPRLFKEYISQGMDPGQAEEKARQTVYNQAADIVWGGKVNVIWQSMSQLNLFRGVAHSRSVGRINSSSKLAGLKSLRNKIAVEMPTEAMEEITTGYLESEARHEVDRELGLRLEDYRSTGFKWAEHATSYEGITEGLTGAFGAGPMGAISTIGQRRQRIDALEQVKLTEALMGDSGNKVKDITEEQFYEHAAMNAYKGTFQNFMDILEGYKNMSAEEAKELGVEENYKEIAEQYISDATAIEEAFNSLVDNPAASIAPILKNSPGALDILFNNKINAYKNEKAIRRYKQELDEALAEEHKLNIDINNKPEEIGLHALKSVGIDIANYQDIIIKLEKQLKDFRKSVKDSPLLVSKESNERESNIKDAIKEAKKRLQELSESKERKIKEEILTKNMSEAEIVEAVNNLEDSGELGAKIKVLKFGLEIARLRRKSAAETYDTYVKHPELLKAEANKLENESNAKKKKEEDANKKSKTDEKTSVVKKVVNKVKKVAEDIISTISPEKETEILAKIKTIESLEELEAYKTQLETDKKASPAIFEELDKRKTVLKFKNGQTVSPDGDLQTPVKKASVVKKTKSEEIADVEKRRQEELDRYAGDIVVSREIYEMTNEEGDTTYVEIRTMKDGTRKVAIGQSIKDTKNNKDVVQPYDKQKIPKGLSTQDWFSLSLDETSFGKPKLRTKDNNPVFNRENKINAKYDAELAALGATQQAGSSAAPQAETTNKLDAISDLIEDATTDETTNKSEYPVHLPSGTVMAIRTSTAIEDTFQDKFTGAGYELNMEWGNLVDRAVEAILGDFTTFRKGKNVKENMIVAAKEAVDTYVESGEMVVDAVIQDEAITAVVDAVYALMESNPKATFKAQVKSFKNVGEKTIAGALDIVMIKENGHVDIIDVKASVESTQLSKYDNNGVSASKKVKHTRQQSMYKAMLEEHGIIVDNIKIMPFKVKDDQNHIVNLTAEPLITLTYNQAVVDAIYEAHKPSSDEAHLSPVLLGDITNEGNTTNTSEANENNANTIPNKDIEIFEDNGEGKSHQLLASQSGAFMSIEYQEIDVTVEDGKVVQKKLSLSNSINENSIDIHSMKSVRSGDPVKISLRGTDGLALSQGALDNMSDEAIAELPVIVSGVINGVETKLMAMHSVEWVSNNSAESVLLREVARAKALRLHLAKAEGNTEISSVVYKGSGLVLQMFEENEDGKLTVSGNRLISKNDPVKESLPNWSNLEMGIAKGGEIYTRYGVVTAKELSSDFLIGDGRVVTLLPTPNGTYFPAILWADKVSEVQANTIIGAAMSFSNINEDTYSLITEKTGLDFGREGAKHALHSFINRYVYASEFSYKLEDREAGFGKNHVLVYVPINQNSTRANSVLEIVDVDNRAVYTNDPKNYFEGTTGKSEGADGRYVGDLKAKYSKDENNIQKVYYLGNEGAAEKAAELLQRKLISVETTRINLDGNFVDVPLNPDGSAVLNSQGTPATSTYPSYNSYKGDMLTTDVNGHNKIEHTDGTTEYVYMTQPTVLFGTDFLEGIITPAKETTVDEDGDIEFFSLAIEEEFSVKTEKEETISDALNAELVEDLVDSDRMSAEMQDQFIQGIFHTYARVLTAGKPFGAISKKLKEHISAKIAGYKKKGSKKLAAYEAILENFDRVEGKVTIEGIILERLKVLDIVPTKEGFTSEGLSEIEFADILESSEDLTKDAYDSEFYKADRKKTAAAEVKLFLASLHDPRLESWAGMSMGIAYQDVYDTLKSLMTNVPGGLNAKLKAVLEASPNPVYKSVVAKIQALPLDLRNKVMITMSGTKLNFVQVLVDSSNPTKTKVVNADNYGTVSNVMEKWLNQLKSSGLTKTVKGEIVVNNNAVDRLNVRYEAMLNIALSHKKDKNLGITSDKFLAQLQGVLREMGMEIPMGGLRHISQGGKKLTAYTGGTSHWGAALQVSTRTGFMSHIFKAFEHELKKGAEDFLAGKIHVNPEHAEATEGLALKVLNEYNNKGLFYMNNPIEGGHAERSVRGLARLTVDYNGVIYGNNFRGADGKSIYPYQNEFGIQRLLQEYKHNPSGVENSLKQLMELSFTRGSIWGNKILENNKDFIIEIAMLDATKMLNSGVRPSERKNQGQFMQEVTSLNLFTNQGSKVGYFLPLTIGDKDVTPLMKATKWSHIDGDTAMSQLTIEDGKVVDIGNKILNTIVEYAMGEYDRIHNHETKEGIDRGAYEEGAKYFYRFDYLNSYDGQENAIWEDGGLVLKKGVQKSAIRAHITEAVKADLLREIQQNIDNVNTLQIGSSYIDGSYKEVVKKGATIDTKNPADLMAVALGDRALNYVISNNEQMILFGNDPAHAYKQNKGDFHLKATIKLTLNNYEKRKADLLSPSTSPEYTSKTVNIVTAFDSEVTIDGKSIERTDGQEYGTVLEALEMKSVHGKIPKAIADKIRAAVTEAIADKNNPLNYYRLSDFLTAQEINRVKDVFVTDKPSHVSNDIQPGQDSNNKLFRKSSTRWLWPSETTGHDLDHLRVAMENLGIQRLGHLSSDKTGSVNVATIYDSKGEFLPSDQIEANIKSTNSIRPVFRSGLGWQQEKPVNKDKVAQSTQLDVLAFDDMGHVKLSSGKTVNELRTEKEKIVSDFYKLGLSTLYKRMGITMDKESGLVTDINTEKVSEFLKKEAKSRKWVKKDIRELDIITLVETGEKVFKSPLMFNHARPNIDSLVLSLIRKEVANIKLPGYGYIQASGAGFRAKGGLTWSEYADTLGTKKEANNVIVYVDPQTARNGFDETKGLQGPRVTAEGEVLPGQILVKPHFKLGNKDIDLTSKEYTRVHNGKRYLKLDAVPRELLQMIGYRIPGQGQSSVMALEVVGFLPATSVATAIIPDEMLAQMGSDFDIDVLYTYRKQYIVSDEGVITKKTDLSELEQLQDDYFELMKELVFDKAYVTSTEPLDNTDIRDAADIVDELKGVSNAIESPSYVSTNIAHNISQRTGKNLIAPASLAATLYAAVQGRGIQVAPDGEGNPRPFIFFETSEGKIELDNISSMGKSTGIDVSTERTASYNNRSVQNAAVDNANEQVLHRAGINDATIDVALFALQYKDVHGNAVPMDQVVYFLRQEAIEMYNSKFDYFSSGAEGGYLGYEQIRDKSFNAVMHDLNTKIHGKIEELDYSSQSVHEYRLNEDGEFVTFSSEELKEQYSAEKNDIYYENQKYILAAFRDLQIKSDPVKKLQRAIMSPRTKALGSTIFDAQRVLENMDTVFRGDLKGLIGVTEALKGTQFETLYNSLRNAYRAFGQVLPFNVISHEGMLVNYKNWTGNADVSPYIREALFTAMLEKGYASAFESAFEINLEEERAEMLFSEENSLAKEIQELQDTEWGKRNLFIQRLLPTIRSSATVPNTISYTASKQEDVKDQMHNDLVALYQSDIVGHRALFERIVKYAYTMGGHKNARSFVQFVPAAYLEESGFYEKLRDEQQRIASQDGTFNTYVATKEWLQHNPRNATVLQESDLTLNQFLAEPLADSKVTFNGKNQLYQIVLKPVGAANLPYFKYTQEVNGVESYKPILAVKSGSRTQLFEQTPFRTEEGGVVFRRIALKGKFTNKYRISEYSGMTPEVYGTAFVENEVPTAAYAAQVLEAGVPDIPISKLTVSTPDKATPYGIKEGMSLDRAGAKELLSSVRENSKNESYRVLSSILLENFDTVGTKIANVIEAKTTTDSKGNEIEIRGAYTNGTIKLNSSLLSKPETAEEVILHEFLHGYLEKELDNKDGELYKTMSRLRAASKSLLKEKTISGEIDGESIEHALLSYAFSNNHEFLAHALTSKAAQLFLNNQKSKKSIWEQISTAIFRFVQSLGKSLGIDIKKDSALVEAVDVILRTLNSENLQKAKSTAKAAKASAVAPGVIQEDGTFNTDHLGVQMHRAAAYSKVSSGVYTTEQVNAAIKKTMERDSTKRGAEHLSPVIVEHIDTAAKFIETITERINRLKSKLTQKNLTELEGQRIRERLASYSRQRKSLKDNKTLAGLQAVYKVQFRWVKEVLANKDATDVERQEAFNIVDSYNYDITSEFLDASDLTDDNVWNKALLDAGRQASALKARILDNLLENIAGEINISIPHFSVTKLDLAEISEEEYIMLKAYTQDLTKFKSPLVKLINKKLKKAARNKDTKIDALFERIDKEWAAVKGHPALVADPNLFMQKDAEGNPSGYFVSRYSDSWRVRRAKLFSKYYKNLEKIDNTPASTDVQKKAQANKRKTAYSILLNNLNNIEIAIDIRYWKNEKGEDTTTTLNSKYKDRDAYIEYLDKELGEDVRKELVASALAQFDKYMVEKSAHGAIIRADLSGAHYVEVEAVLDNWQSENSPLISLNARYGTQRGTGKQFGHRRLITAPRKVHKTSKKALNYYDPSFTRIQNDSSLKTFYKFYIDEMQEMIKVLPDNVVAQLPENFFPAAQRAFAENLQNEGLATAWTSMKDFKFKSLLSLSGRAELDPVIVSEGSREVDTGRPNKSIPVRMLSGVDSDKKSYDIKRVMKMFGAMAANFEFKSEVEDRVLLLQRALREAKHLQLDAQGKPIKLHDKVTNLSIRGGLTSTRMAVDYAIDSGLYGLSTSVDEKHFIANREATRIHEELKGFEDKLAAGEITQSEFNVEKVRLDEEYNKVDPTKFSGGVIADNLIKFTQLKGMGWNIGAGFNNMGFGTIANYVHAAGGEDFSTDQLAQAYWMTMKSSGQSVVKATKIGHLAKKYGILFEQLDDQYGKEPRTERNMLSALSPYEIQRRTEFLNQIAPFIAKMLNTTIDEKGTTLFDAYDEKGNWKAEHSEVAEEWSTDLEATTDNKFTAFRDASIEMNKVNHGNYDPNSALLLKKSTLGRAAAMFRTWMFEGFNTRFAAQDYNEQLDRYTKGRWRSYGTVGAKKSMMFLVKGLINQLTLNRAISDGSMQGEMTELDYVNMKKNLSELKAALILLMASNLLRALAEGEDDEAIGAYRFLANISHRLLQDIAFYISPGTFMQILKNPTPIVKTLGDFSKAFNATIKYHTQDDYQGDPLLKKWAKTVPLGSPIYSLDYALTEDVSK